MADMKPSSRVAWVSMAIGTLLTACSPVMFIAAIWVVGPNSARLAGTACVVLLVGALLGFFGALHLSVEDDR